MSMVMTQVRLPKKILQDIELLVESGFYETKSDVVRDAVRRLLFDKQVASLNLKGNSVKEVKKIRKKLSSKRIDLNEINSLQ